MFSGPNTTTRIRIEIFSGPNTTLPCFGNPPHGFSYLRYPVNTERNSLYDCIEGVDRVDWDLGQSLFTRRVGELLVALYFLFGQSYLIYNFLELIDSSHVIKGKGSCIYSCGRVKTRSFCKRLE